MPTTARPAPRADRDLSRPLPSSLSWTVLIVFVAAFAVAYVVLDLPWWLPAISAGLSVVAFAAYGLDKAAAGRAGRRRTPESTLHLLGLLGGWPGALVAQQLFRHKTRKRSFRRVFWFTVVLNVLALSLVIALLAHLS